MTREERRNSVWEATLDEAKARPRLADLLPAIISAPDMAGRLRRLDDRYRVFCRTSSIPPYASGLVVTSEMHREVEVYLPLAEIRKALARFCSLAMTSDAPLEGTIAEGVSWYAILHHLHRSGLNCPANPAQAIQSALVDYDFRRNLLFALFLPQHYGGSFHRYPKQMAFLSAILQKRPFPTAIRCLDAACGTGEQTWEVASELGRLNIPYVVEGVSLNPLEVFAAAHGFFPGDRLREMEYRGKMHDVLQANIGRLTFRMGDIAEGIGAGKYHLILCNGLIGGPFIHDEITLRKITTRLAQGLQDGGFILVSDRFHDGWKKRMPQVVIQEAFAESSMRLIWRGDGFAAEKIS